MIARCQARMKRTQHGMATFPGLDLLLRSHDLPEGQL